MALMTPKALKQVCREHNLYQTPYLNDKIYLHYKGWASIDPCLGEYSGLKAIWLEGNGLMTIENLEGLKELRCLFIQNNCIEDISGLDDNACLDTINLSNNQIRRLAGLDKLPVLKTLTLTNNRITEYDDLVHLLDCSETISCLDLSNNKIDDPRVLEIFESMPGLSVLQLTGNPVIRKIQNYRKVVINRIPSLNYLDDRPVFPDEKRCAIAWARGGHEEEKRERALIRQEQQERDKRNFEAMRRMQEEGRQKRIAECLAQGIDPATVIPDYRPAGSKGDEEDVDDAEECDDKENQPNSPAWQPAPAPKGATRMMIQQEDDDVKPTDVPPLEEVPVEERKPLTSPNRSGSIWDDDEEAMESEARATKTADATNTSDGAKWAVRTPLAASLTTSSATAATTESLVSSDLAATLVSSPPTTTVSASGTTSITSSRPRPASAPAAGRAVDVGAAGAAAVSRRSPDEGTHAPASIDEAAIACEEDFDEVDMDELD